ncbi:hypothetical protein LY76DRAFT_587024 [Colletotrichum caudatum]|nr:hypothetical protein LY76DRAFT_587024 [Colletotrichum caudatum]
MVLSPIFIFVFTFLAGLLAGFVPRYGRRSYALQSGQKYHKSHGCSLQSHYVQTLKIP